MPQKSPITCHVLDASLGKPAANVQILLQRLASDPGTFDHPRPAPVVAKGVTDADGRCHDLLETSAQLPAGTYKMCFLTGPYFAARSVETFYPFVEITFTYADPSQHYHIPLLLNPYSYTTYRGS